MSSPGDYGGYYPGEGDFGFGSPLSSDARRCCEDRVCNCLAGSTAAIAAALEGIEAILDERLGRVCDNIDQCLDELIAKIKKRWETGERTCEECKSMLRSGMGGTVEYAIACAGACINETEAICSAGDESTWGKPCSTCGQSPCCCNRGICEPGPCEQKQEHRYIGWCNPLENIVQVTRSDAPPLAPPWYQVGITDTEQAAIRLAEDDCKSETTYRPKTYPANFPPVGASSPWCDLSAYTKGTILQNAADVNSTIERITGMVQLQHNIGELGMGGITIENIASIVTGAIRTFTGSKTEFAREYLTELVDQLGCKGTGVDKAISSIISLGLAQTAMGVNLDNFIDPYRYAANALCRYKHLDPDKAIAAYFGNSIDDVQLDTYWAINGLCPDDLQQYKYAARAKPTPLQAAFLHRRGIIDYRQYDQMMRELGYLEEPIRKSLFKLTEYFPPYTDVVRLMVRDAADESIEFWPESDRIWEQKYSGKLRYWGESQGIPDEVTKLIWRAHWSIPSPGQLFEFWHRLRHNPKFGGQEKLLERIKSALTQQDILPFWHDYYLAVSYRPMFRRDIRRAFEIGAINEKQVFDAYIQLGHSDDTAKVLTDYVKRLRDRAVAGHRSIRLWRQFAIDRNQVIADLKDDGIPDDVINKALSQVEQTFDKSPYGSAFAKGYIDRSTLISKLQGIGVSLQGAEKIAARLALRIRNHPALKGYAAGAITRQDAIAQMQTFGMDTNIAMQRVSDIDDDVKFALLQRCQNGIKHRYLGGELTKGKAITELVARGTVKERADQLADEWDCEKSSIGRAIPTNTMCQMLDTGAINAIDMKERLENIGYSEDSADLIVGNCLDNLSAKRAKQQQQALRQQQYQARLAARQQRIAEAAQRRDQNAMIAARRRAATTRQRRERQLMSATEKLHKKCACDFYTALGVVRTQREHVIQDYGLSIDETLALLIKSAESFDTGELDSYAGIVDALAQEFIASKDELNATTIEG